MEYEAFTFVALWGDCSLVPSLSAPVFYVASDVKTGAEKLGMRLEQLQSQLCGRGVVLVIRQIMLAQFQA